MEVPNANDCRKNLPKLAKMYLELLFFEKDLLLNSRRRELLRAGITEGCARAHAA